MTENLGAGSLVPTQDERTMATLAHALQIIGSWIAPLVILCVKRESRFVSFHALQALLLQVCYTVLMVVVMVLWFVFIFSTIALNSADKTAPPTALLVVFPVIWLVFMGGWVFNLVMTIVYSIKAGHGEWAEYPLIGRLARRILKIGPGGAILVTP